MIVFDECHHANNEHMYNEIMRRYLDLKLRGKVDSPELPQIVGLTASLGVAGKPERDQGEYHMKKIMANMDAKFLCTVRRPDSIRELKLYVNPPVEKLLSVPGRADDLFKNEVEKIAKRIFDHMAKDPECELWKNCKVFDVFINLAVRNAAPEDKFIQKTCILPATFGTEKYQQWNADFVKAIAKVQSEDIRRVINPHRIHLENARGIIFVRTRELAQALVKWVNETDSLNVLNASEFVGQGVSASVGGMTKVGQKDALESFKAGQHRLLFATSVAEEGLDISKCNLVIRYEHVTNEIVRLQSRGRARAENSSYYVIAEEGSWILEKEEKNRRCEELMEQIVAHIQVYIEDHANIWERELLEIQEKIKQEEERQSQKRELNMTDASGRFECFNCSSFICLSDDIRVIKGSHHVIIDEDAKRRLILNRGAPTFTEPEGAQYGGTLYCAKEECRRKLGSICTYKGSEFP
ncbi:IFIH1-like protein, partial [Mya arenaria]